MIIPRFQSMLLLQRLRLRLNRRTSSSSVLKVCRGLVVPRTCWNSSLVRAAVFSDKYLSRSNRAPNDKKVNHFSSDFNSFIVDTECRIRKGVSGIHLMYHKSGKPTGQAFIELEDEEDVNKALEMHRQYLGPRYVEGRSSHFTKYIWKHKNLSSTNNSKLYKCIFLLPTVFKITSAASG